MEEGGEEMNTVDVSPDDTVWLILFHYISPLKI